MSFSDWLENAALDWAFGGAAPTRPTARYVSLHTADPGDTGASELASAGYGRIVSTFAASALGATSNAGAVTWTNSSGSAWTAVTHFCVWDALTAGNCLGSGALSAGKTIANGDTATFAIGDLDITLT
jgi:hypothetical protein